MPELPEVETMRRGILELTGRRIADVERVRCRLKPIHISPRPDRLRRRMVGHHIDSVGRIGKRVALHLDSGDAVVLEPRMTGLVLLADPPDREHLRLRIDFAGRPATQLWYWDRRGLGSVRLVTSSELQELFGPSRLGPDALQVGAEALRARLGDSRRAIKVALLDQRALAGIGNLYASEILHVAGIHPETACHRLTRRQWQQLRQATIDVLELAILYEGSTLGDGTYRNALNRPGRFQNHHRVYNRAGQLCPQCGAEPICRIVQAQRSTFFCPGCQKRKRGSP